jgi:hypothetical protein
MLVSEDRRRAFTLRNSGWKIKKIPFLKNKPKNKPGHVIENKRGLKIALRVFPGSRTTLESDSSQLRLH